jgi:hypothetical protein
VFAFGTAIEVIIDFNPAEHILGPGKSHGARGFGARLGFGLKLKWKRGIVSRIKASPPEAFKDGVWIESGA